MHSAPCLTMQTLAHHTGRPVLSRGVWSPLDEFYCMFLCHPYLDFNVLSLQSANRHVGAMLPVISALLCFFLFLFYLLMSPKPSVALLKFGMMASQSDSQRFTSARFSELNQS